MMHTLPASENDQVRLRHGAWMLGFALGGFFDGILLHQILQWHHLLSGLEQARLSLHDQVLFDGLFHLLMYLIAFAALWLLLRARTALQAAGAARRLVGWALIGFGLWHVVDSVLSHWLLGIHRIRMDSDTPLFWDLLWLGVFGILPLLLGWLLKSSAGSGTGTVMAAGLALVVGVAGWQSAMVPAASDGTRSVTVVLRDGVAPAGLFAGLSEADARLVWTDGRVWVVALEQPARAWTLYRHGALWVGGSWLPAGCSAWIRS